MVLQIADRDRRTQTNGRGEYIEGEKWSDNSKTDALTKRQTDRQSERERWKIMEADGRIETDRREAKKYTILVLLRKEKKTRERIME